MISQTWKYSRSQVEKVVQTYETVMTRHCTMIVGPSGGGKTVVIQTLAKAQTSLGLTTELFVLNPKVRTCCDSRTQLLFTDKFEGDVH